MVLAPTALILGPKTKADANGPSSEEPKELARLDRRYMLLRTRRRVTKDGGSSILVLGK